MSTRHAPTIRELTRAEIDEILSRNHVGRLAYAQGNRVDIEPIHYVYSDGWIYGRTGAERKLEVTGGGWWPVAFEVDEVDDMFEWRSVVIHGGFYTIASEGPEWEQETYNRAVGLLRRLIPETLREDDPVPFRNVLFRIAVQEATGREATTSAAGT